MIPFLTIFAGLLVIYHHLIYPKLLSYFAERRREAQQSAVKERVDEDQLPSLELIMPAYNEAAFIAEKIRNLAMLSYPEDRFSVVIGCDGCTDNTYKIAAKTLEEPECRGLKVRLVQFAENRGKVAVINQLVQESDAELVALSDVSALLSIDGLLQAASQFANPKVGVLTGQYLMLNSLSSGEQKYWHYQSKIKSDEAELGATLGAHGAFYLFKRVLFQPLAADTINDDFILPMQIVAQGYLSLYQYESHAVELESASEKMDFQRRKRISAGNTQQLLRLLKLLHPRFGWVSFMFFSGKALRVLMPYCLIIALFGSVYLSEQHIVFKSLFLTQAALYLSVIIGFILPKDTRPKILVLLQYLVGGHFAGLIGSLRYLCGLDRGRWKRVSTEIK